MDQPPKKSHLWMLAFAVQMSRGLIRDQQTRRKAMFFALLAAMFMMFAGVTFLQGCLAPREHPFWFIGYWFACAWITVLAALLAVFDLLLVRAQARAAANLLRKQYADRAASAPPESDDS